LIIQELKSQNDFNSLQHNINSVGIILKGKILDKKSSIMLEEGDTFKILDLNKEDIFINFPLDLMLIIYN
ncbi:MAG: hypothetical protein Q7R87_00030, partial [Nanoarchaeota archaeon]|nr:hypothetical protein [Nanoarchaeota archaeon]